MKIRSDIYFFLQFFDNKSFGNWKINPKFKVKHFKLLIFCVFLGQIAFHCKTVDYTYRHDISGKVIDTKGKEISGAVVCKIESKIENCSDRNLYTRTTDLKGNFQFIYSGLGGKPEAKMNWILLVKHPKYNPFIQEFTIDWTPFRNSPEYGYIKKELVLELKNGDDSENQK